MSRITRLEILNRLTERFGYRDYLEIGVAGGATFRNIKAPTKTGVDPQWRLWNALRFDIKKTTSDRFFARNRRTFDLVLVDGLHHADQAFRDIQNALGVLRPGGSILVHDCLPESYEQQAVPRISVSWTGDVWRAFLKTCQDTSLSTLVFDTNRGCGLIRRPATQPQRRPPANVDPLRPEDVTWEHFAAERDNWLEIVPRDAVYATVDTLQP